MSLEDINSPTQTQKKGKKVQKKTEATGRVELKVSDLYSALFVTSYVLVNNINVTLMLLLQVHFVKRNSKLIP